jgi:septum formation protein
MFDMTPRGPFRINHPLILASASPRRQALLSSLGIHFEVIPAKGKEPDPDAGEAPADYAQRMALFKAREIASKRPEAVVIGADTIVVQGSTILGKPRSREDALDMLTRLCGTTHEVMPPRDRTILEAYISTGEPMDKAGSYAIQGVGGFLVSEIRGSYTNVVGLPLAKILKVLLDWKAVVPAETKTLP